MTRAPGTTSGPLGTQLPQRKNASMSPRNRAGAVSVGLMFFTATLPMSTPCFSNNLYSAGTPRFSMKPFSTAMTNGAKGALMPMPNVSFLSAGRPVPTSASVAMRAVNTTSVVRLICRLLPVTCIDVHTIAGGGSDAASVAPPLLSPFDEPLPGDAQRIVLPAPRVNDPAPLCRSGDGGTATAGTTIRPSLTVRCRHRSIPSGRTAMAIIGTGKYRYELIENWARLPAGQTFGNVSAVATD